MGKIPKIEGGANVVAFVLLIIGILGLPFYGRYIFEVFDNSGAMNWTDIGIYIDILLIACPIAALIISIVNLVADKKCGWAKTIILIIVLLALFLVFYILAQGGMKSISNPPPDHLPALG